MRETRLVRERQIPLKRECVCLSDSAFLSDIDECAERVLACPGLDEICTNIEGSFSCDCAEGLTRKNNVCVQKRRPSKCSHTHAHTQLYRHSNGAVRVLEHTCPHHSHRSTPSPGDHERSLFEDIQEEEVEVLQQMIFGVLLCALATLAAKGDMVFTSIFMGGVAAMAGYWLSDRGERAMGRFLKRP